MKKWLALKLDAWLAAVAGRFALAAADKWDNKLRVLVDMTERLRLELRLETTKRMGFAQRAESAEAKLKLARHYLDDVPVDMDEVQWTADDAKQLAHFLEVMPAGKKLAQHLANRVADYERFAMRCENMTALPLLVKRAHGFRDARGEILRLSAAGPSPAKREEQDMALPADLENLRA